MSGGEDKGRIGTDRRSLLAAGMMVGLGAAAPGGAQQARSSSSSSSAAASYASRMFPVVETATGRVQGVANQGISTFSGIPYGASTAGSNRFMPPQPVMKWAGVLDCIGNHRQTAPQALPDLASDYINMVMWDLHGGAGGRGEDCLNLNVWTPGVNDMGKRPVMVYFHGGSFRWGSGNGPQFNGARLSRFGNVVVVTVNHRLNAFGYLELGALGAPAEFRNAGAAGARDMVAALRWVRDNIERFGGDPGRVLIYGQSGGGGKVGVLMSMPSARGLFHRAAIMSGSYLRVREPAAAAKMTERLLAKLGLSVKDLSALQHIPWQQIIEAQLDLNIDGEFAPVMGNEAIPHHPFDPGAPPESGGVPLLVSSTRHDLGFTRSNFDMDEAVLKDFFRKSFAGRGEEVYAAYRQSDPHQPPFLVQAEALTDATLRKNAFAMIERKVRQGGAPAYHYIWDWQSPAFDGKFGAVHCTDTEAAFHLYRDPILGAGRGTARLMCDRLAGALVAFAATGKPGDERIPDWPSYDLDRRATMVFDDETRVEQDYRGELVRLAASAFQGQNLFG